MSDDSSTQRVVVGTCIGLEEGRNGWYVVKIGVPGKQYPVKASTKLEHLLSEARRIRDEGLVATWTIKDQLQFNDDGSPKMNPNSGKQYENHYLDGVEEGAAAASAASASSGPAPKHEPMHFADKDRVVSRLSLLKTAAALVDPDKEEDIFFATMREAGRLERWVYRDIDPVPSEGGTTPPPAEPAEEPESSSDEPQPDDDIPF